MIVWFASIAGAATPSEEAWYLWDTGQVDEAMSAALAALQADPADIAMHRVWAWAQVKGARGEEPTKALYRSWAEADPSDPLPRIMLGTVTVWAMPRDQGPWCSEAEQALAVQPTDPLQAYYVARERHTLHERCPGDVEADRAAIEALEAPESQGYRLVLRMGYVDVDDAWVDDLEAWLAEHPTDLARFTRVYWQEATGDGLARARTVLLDAAAAALASGDRVAVRAAERVFTQAQDDRADAARAALAELDPNASTLVLRDIPRSGSRWAPRDPWDERLWWDIWRAQRKRGGFRAVRALSALDARIPESGPLRTAWLQYLAENHGTSMRGATAREHWRLAFESSPGDPDAAMGWAEAALWADEDLEPALAAIDVALDPGPWDPRHDDPEASSWAEWRARRAVDQAQLLGVRARLVDALGRGDEARATLRQALLVQDDPDLHLILGLLYAEDGQEEAALYHLGRGVAAGATPDDMALLRQARRQAEALYERLAWGPDFDTWLAAQVPTRDTAPTEAPTSDDSTQAWRVGQSFPDLALDYQGEQTTLSAIGGVRVVDLWATWCGPCKASIPVLDDAAERFADRGVTVLVVSVDRDRPAFDRYKKFGTHHEIAWAGPEAMTEAKVTGIPATFVIDADGVVRAYHSGYQSDDERLAEALDTILAEKD